MATWDDAFVERLTGRFAIRYDLRDTGRSTTVDPVDLPGYTLRDLVTDAAGVLDGLGIARAHVVGIATGGFIAQLLALDHPSRVASLVLAGTRPVAPGPADDDLAGNSPVIMAYFGSAPPSTGPTARRSWTVRWPRPACSPARRSSTPPRRAPTRPVFSIAAVRTRRRRATAC